MSALTQIDSKTVVERPKVARHRSWERSPATDQLKQIDFATIVERPKVARHRSWGWGPTTI